MEKSKLYGTAKRQYLHYIILVVCIAATAAFLIAMYSTDNKLFQIETGLVTFRFDNVLVILITGVIGFVPAMISFVILFIGSVVVDINQSYLVFVYLIASILSFTAVRNGWFKGDNIKVWLLAPGLAFILGDLRLLLDSLVDGAGLSYLRPANAFYHFIGELPECVLGVFLVYLFLNKLPEKYRTITTNGCMYSGIRIEIEDTFSMMRSSKLSRRVSLIIIAEGVILGIGAAVFANTLLPSISDDAFAVQEGGALADMMAEQWFDEEMSNSITVTTDEDLTDSDSNDSDKSSSASQKSSSSSSSANNGKTSSSTESDDTSSALEDSEAEAARARFILNRSGLAFDIKLIMLLMSTAIPFVVLANAFAQRTIVRPILKIEGSITDFCRVEQDEKEQRLEEIQKLDIKNRDEIGDLYDAVSNMATNITNFVDEEREKEKLAADLLIAQKTSENKSNFLSSMSHELRTPINAVLGLDEMIIRESKDEAITHYATDIQNAGKSLLGLVNDILDSSKLEAGKMDLIPTEYELSSTINDLINMISVKTRDKGLDFFVNVDEQTPHILYGDEIRLKQVILNILTNAAKYTEEGSVTMNIGFEKTGTQHINLKVEVKDTGIGIKQEDIDKLFSRFERIEEERNKDIEGTGLGMSIVRALLELMGTELEVESVYGEGSTFRFAVRQKVQNWHPIGNFTEMYEKMVAGNNEYSVSFVAPDAKILVVDDTPLNLTVVKGLLKPTKVQIFTAESGTETLDLIKKYKYDIIFLDQRMPGMDGVETLHEMEVQEDNKCKDVPVIVLTANAVSGSRERFLKEGFTNYISKPIDSKMLEQMVREYLPKELVLEPSEVPDETENELKSGTSIRSPLAGITSIDYDEAMKNCGSEELLVSVLSDYLEAVPTRSADIERYLSEGDFENYTILVHSLKSSSRLIGAMQLSKDSEELESLGDSAKKGNPWAIEEIRQRTPELISMYRSYYDKLMPLISNESDEDIRPEIDEDSLNEAYTAIRELVDAFDYDSADSVMFSLKDYRIPEGEIDHFEKVKRALAEVDRTEILNLI